MRGPPGFAAAASPCGRRTQPRDRCASSRALPRASAGRSARTAAARGYRNRGQLDRGVTLGNGRSLTVVVGLVDRQLIPRRSTVDPVSAALTGRFSSSNESASGLFTMACLPLFTASSAIGTDNAFGTHTRTHSISSSRQRSRHACELVVSLVANDSGLPFRRIAAASPSSSRSLPMSPPIC